MYVREDGANELGGRYRWWKGCAEVSGTWRLCIMWGFFFFQLEMHVERKCEVVISRTKRQLRHSFFFFFAEAGQ